MIKKLLTGFLISFLSYSGVVFSQATDNWYFGSAAGFPNTGLRVSFTTGSPVVTTGYPISTEEGSSSISDASGNPLFYTDGLNIWDASTNVAFGTGLNGGSSSTQSAVIMPRPGSTNQWLLFTSGNNGSPGLTYYTVSGTTGGFSISAGTSLVAAGAAGEGLCIVGNSAVPGAFWVICRDYNQLTPSVLGVPGQVRAFSVSSTGGVNTTPVLSSLSGASFTNTEYKSTIGTIKANTCQNKLAFSYLSGNADIVDFDAATGRVVTNTARRINVVSTGGNSGSYGLEFSPNDAYLYLTNLSSGNLYRYTVATNTLATFGNVAAGNEAGQLQVGPDGNIYLANRNASPATAPNYLGIISTPGLAGATFIPQAILLSGVVNGSGNFGFVYRGLPTFPKSLIVANVQINPSTSSFCTGSPNNISYTFAGSASSQTWTVNPGSGWTYTAGTSTSLSPIITFNVPGTYTITSTVNDNCGRTLIDQAVYTITDPLIAAGTICTAAGVSLTLAASGGNAALYPRYVWFSNATSTSPIGIGSSVTLNYSDPSRVPSTIWVEVSSTATSISSGSNTLAGSALGGAAEASPYGPVPFSVLANNVRFKSFVVKTWTGSPGNFDVVIRNASNAIVFQKTYSIATNGTNYTVDINTNFQTGSYTITLTNTGMQWYRGTWPGQSVANQFDLPFFGNGTYSLANVAYDYSNFSYVPTCSNRIAVSSCIPLPVNLLKFEGELINDKVELNWSTSYEKNNDRFEIQRSSDGIHFSTIKNLKGAGNSSRITEYTTTDNSPAPKTNYYRLVQYDVDGKESISEVISVNVISEELDFTISPNPSTNTFSLYLKNVGSGEISITDLLGKLVLTKALSSEVNLFEFGEDLVKGAYVVKVSSTNGSATKLIIKE